ncbi:MAG: prepilin peptidase [Proteobacteria bacterium]|nr:prepilin peptidase [Pseudomonadota bacterium]
MPDLPALHFLSRSLTSQFTGYPGLVSITVFLFGAVLGSFANVLIYRLPEKNLLKQTRSHCRHCGAMIPFWLNIPLFSWFLLRGKTACCQQPYSCQYPLVEWLTACGFVAIYWYHPFLNTNDNSLSLTSSEALVRFIHNGLFFYVLLVGSFIDFRLKIIPNILTVGLIVTAPIWIFIHPELSASSSLLGILLGGLIPLSISLIYRILRGRDGLGLGDVKLLAGMGGWLGYQSIIPTLFTASIVGSVLGITQIILSRGKLGSQTEIPFGPYLAFGALLWLYTGTHVIELMFFNVLP